MKIAIVTWITYRNFGTLLQGYALQSCLECMGHDTWILSDQSVLGELQRNRPKETTGATEENGNQPAAARLWNLLRNPQRIHRVVLSRFFPDKYCYPLLASQRAFEKFRKEYMHVHEGILISNLQCLDDSYDAFVCGSDQIWSVLNPICPYYFLDFTRKRKIAYAPSLGTTVVSEDKMRQIVDLTKGFSALSVREFDSAIQLSQKMKRDVQWVCDPTLLHDKEFWSRFTQNTPVRKGKYLVCYFLENKPWYFQKAQEIAKSLRLPVVLIPNRYEFLARGEVFPEAVGPCEFVSLIQNAEYVLTDSYHGSIFSLIFERPFLYFQRFSETDPNSQNLRITSLFRYLDIFSVCVSEHGEYNLNSGLAYEQICERLQKFRTLSRRYLADSLERNTLD